MPADSVPTPAVDPAMLAALVNALADPAVVAALTALGTPVPARPIPTVEAYLLVVRKAARRTTSDTYGTYWRLLVRELGDKRLDEVYATDLKALAKTARLGADHSTPAVILVVDEWAELAAAGTTKQRGEAQDLLRRFVSLGRAVGCSAVLATQRPTSDSIDTGTRALLAHRLALRCGDRWQSEAILGQGLTDATRIPLASPGYGFLTDGGPPRVVQDYDAVPERIPDLACAGLRVALSH